MTNSLGSLLDEGAPDASVDQAQALAAEHFGVEAVAVALASERDRNFRMTRRGGQEWILKVVHPAEDPGFTELQSRVLIHLADRDPGLPVPRVLLPSTGGRPDILWQPLPGTRGGHASCRVRMYSFLPGVPLYRSSSTPTLRRHLGRTLARLDRGLHSMHAPEQIRELAWDAQHVDRVSSLLDDNAVAARRALEHVTEHAGPQLGRLRAQLIHNDLNPHNVLTAAVDRPQISGVIDFGDMVRGPLVQDLATAAAYQLGTDRGHPLAGAAEVASAFHAECPLFGAEIDVLFDLIVARLVLIEAITSWRARRHPENRDYILRNSGGARLGLRRLAEVDCHAAQSYFHSFLGS